MMKLQIDTHYKKEGEMRKYILCQITIWMIELSLWLRLNAAMLRAYIIRKYVSDEEDYLANHNVETVFKQLHEELGIMEKEGETR